MTSKFMWSTYQKNCTSVYQLVDVVIEHPFKYVFGQHFTKFIIDIIKKTIEEMRRCAPQFQDEQAKVSYMLLAL